MKLLEELETDLNHLRDTLYKLPDTAKELVSENLWVLDKSEDGCHEFYFLEFDNGDSKETWAKLLMHGRGFLGNLKECRHTYWGDEGYIFYPNKKYIEAILNYLEKCGYELS